MGGKGLMYANFKKIIDIVNNTSPLSIGIANAHEKGILGTVKHAIELNLISPHLIGNKAEIISIADEIGLDLSKFNVYDARNEDEAAYLAAKLASNGTTNAIMKGMINSTPFLKGILNKQLQLVKSEMLSHIAAFEIPDFNRIIFMTDGGLNISPNFEQKKQIIRNAINFLNTIGIDNPKVALLSANERVNERMPITVEFRTITDLAKKGDFGDVVLDGPLPLDVAISEYANNNKGITSKIGGRADLLYVPNIEAGNILGKSIVYFAKGEMAGLVLGAKVPIILNSRNDSQYSKMSSIALAKLVYEQCSRGNN